MITILAVGRIKEQYYRDALDEYVKRISRYEKIAIVEVRDEDTDSPEQARRLEGERLLAKLPKNAYIITLEIDGEQLSSLQLARRLRDIYTHKGSSICFVIGGSCGLHESVTARSDMALSFSPLTFPHQLFRVMLSEQLYRCFKINNNEAYHK